MSVSANRHFARETAVRKLFAESLGTFALVFAGTGSIITNDISGGSVTHVGIALTFGLVVMAMIYALGEISGAHMNPAVTFGFFLAKRFGGAEVLPYMAAQIVGALVASGLLRVLFPLHASLGATLPSGVWWQSFVLEFVLTFLLMLVALCVSSGSKEQGVMAGAAIGAVVMLEAMFAGPICGASMNPARSLAPALMSGKLEDLWIYLIAPTIGAGVAVAAWRCLQPVGQSSVQFAVGSSGCVDATLSSIRSCA